MALRSTAEIRDSSPPRKGRKGGSVAARARTCILWTDIVAAAGGVSAVATYPLNRRDVFFLLLLILLVTQNFSFWDFLY